MYSEISIIIPCYKEAAVIRETLLSIDTFLRPRFERFEILVVTDGSPDETISVVKETQKEHPAIPIILFSFKKNRGKGAAIRTGIMKSIYDPILFLDADLTISIHELEVFLFALKNNVDIVIASRLLSGSRFEEPSPWHRILMARVFHLLQIFILGNFEFPDTQCGFKLFRRSTALNLFRKSTVNRFAFDAEILFLARQNNYKITTLPVTIKIDQRNTNVRIIRDSLNMIFALFKIRLNQLSGRYRT
ncbi:MAG: glycosyltransferase [Candidatus Moranbacteria bacterium]|jgi:glycosyltransferase involved in cell wall biosynthesis|nr:glycosyltransferase [Candidatus Moranbacteria bacterium]MBP9801697.1 glycosyltransferase [Candidatus Moranbacteria bacterium]